MAKPTLFWGVIENTGLERDKPYRLIRITRDSGVQLSGVREGDINSVTIRAWTLKGRFDTEEAARAAVDHVKQKSEPIRARIHKAWEDARAAEAELRATVAKVFETYPGARKQCP